MPEQWLVPTVLKYRDFGNWAQLVESAAMSAIYHACADYNITAFQNERGIIQQTMEDNLRVKLEGEDGSGASLISLRNTAKLSQTNSRQMKTSL